MRRIWSVHFDEKIYCHDPYFISWETKVQILSEFCCKIECHKPFSTLNYECSHAVTNNTSIIPAQTKYYYYQIFPVAVRWIFGCWWKFITYDGFIYSHKKKSCGGNFTKPSRNATHSSSKWQMHVFHSDSKNSSWIFLEISYRK